MISKRDEDELTRRLRAGDPAAGEPGLSGPDRVRMRQRMLSEARSGRRASGWLVPAVAALVILALGLGLALRRPPAPGPGTLQHGAHAARADDPSGHQVQFTTDQGTLVVWLLRPRSAG